MLFLSQEKTPDLLISWPSCGSSLRAAVGRRDQAVRKLRRFTGSPVQRLAGCAFARPGSDHHREQHHAKEQGANRPPPEEHGKRGRDQQTKSKASGIDRRDGDAGTLHCDPMQPRTATPQSGVEKRHAGQQRDQCDGIENGKCVAGTDVHEHRSLDSCRRRHQRDAGCDRRQRDAWPVGNTHLVRTHIVTTAPTSRRCFTTTSIG